jgi:short-subunit dehydrogenase
VTSLAGRVVVVARADDPAAAPIAHALAAAGADIVLGGEEQATLASLASDVADRHGVRVAVFVGDAASDTGALAEMVAELFAPEN